MANKKKNFDQQFLRGLPVGLAIGVALALTLDNWGFLAIGIALAAAFGAAASEEDED